MVFAAALAISLGPCADAWPGRMAEWVPAKILATVRQDWLLDLTYDETMAIDISHRVVEAPAYFIRFWDEEEAPILRRLEATLTRTSGWSKGVKGMYSWKYIRESRDHIVILSDGEGPVGRHSVDQEHYSRLSSKNFFRNASAFHQEARGKPMVLIIMFKRLELGAFAPKNVKV